MFEPALQVPDISLELRSSGHPANGKMKSVIHEAHYYKYYRKEIERELLDGRVFITPEQIKSAVIKFKKCNPNISDDLLMETERTWIEQYLC